LDDNETEEAGTVGITWGYDNGWDTVINQEMMVSLEPPADPIPWGVENGLVLARRTITEAFEPMPPRSAIPASVFTRGEVWQRIAPVRGMAVLSMSILQFAKICSNRVCQKVQFGLAVRLKISVKL
jgi:hypothetical protein